MGKIHQPFVWHSSLSPFSFSFISTSIREEVVLSKKQIKFHLIYPFFFLWFFLYRSTVMSGPSRWSHNLTRHLAMSSGAFNCSVHMLFQPREKKRESNRRYFQKNGQIHDIYTLRNFVVTGNLSEIYQFGPLGWKKIEKCPGYYRKTPDMRLVACYDCATKMECTVMDDYGKGGNTWFSR